MTLRDDMYGPVETNTSGFLVPAAKAQPRGPQAQSTNRQDTARTVEIPSAGPNTWFKPVYGDTDYNPGSYGYRKPPEKGGHIHWAIDIYGKKGQPVLAPVEGKITGAGYGDIAGFYVKMRGNDGIDYYFAHLDSQPLVVKGQRVSAGMAMGGVGDTGNAKGTKPHLHFSMKKNGKPINPHQFMQTGQQQSMSQMLQHSGHDVTDAEMWARQAELMAPYAQSNAQGIDPANWTLDSEVEQTGRQAPGATGQRFLGSMMDGMSAAIAGGSRSPVTRNGGTLQTDYTIDNPALDEVRNVPMPEMGEA